MTFPAAPGAGRRLTAGNAIESAAAAAGPRQPQEALIAAVGLLVTGHNLEKTLGHVLELACAVLPGGDEGGITLLAADGPGTVIATSDVVRRLDRAQYGAETGGPCLDACRRQEIRHIDSTASDQRWPGFSGAASAEGIASTLSIPLVVSGDGLGSLNIYCYRENGFPATDERLAVALGRCASAALGRCGSAALANARAYWRTARLAG
jgi:GAF domain-containing protein